MLLRFKADLEACRAVSALCRRLACRAYVSVASSWVVQCTRVGIRSFWRRTASNSRSAWRVKPARAWLSLQESRPFQCTSADSMHAGVEGNPKP